MGRLSREETARLIKEMSGKIVITTHKSPDGDAVGSCLGWLNFLKKLGKEVKAVMSEKVPYFFDFLPDVESVEVAESIESADWLIITDTSEFERTGLKSINAESVLIIDHHITASPSEEFYYLIEPEISSTCELSYFVMKLINEELIDKSVAVPIYTGILTDTGCFRYSNTSPETHSVASELLKKGVEPYFVSSNLFERNRVSKFKLLEYVLGTLEMWFEGKVASVVVYKEFLKKANASPEESEGFVNYPRSIEGVEVAVLFREIDGGWKISLRSKGKVDVSQIAKELGGGGHKMASGYEVRTSLSSAKRQLKEILGQVLGEGK